MIVFGGLFENGTVPGEMLNLDLQFYDWNLLYPKGQQCEPFHQGKCTAVMLPKNRNQQTGTLENQMTRMSDTILDGVYYFGGKNAKGELMNKLRYLKPSMSDEKVTGVEWVKIKQQGNPPCGRTGHSLSYLPVN
jgi:hypothetical protein